MLSTYHLQVIIANRLTDVPQQPSTKLFFTGLCLKSVHIVVVGKRRLNINIYFYHAKGGQWNVSIILVTPSKMYFGTI